MSKLLIVYASKAGSTADVAENIATTLKERGFDVEILPANQVKSVEGYDGVVFGTAIRMGKPIREAMRFVNKFHNELKALPAAVFSLGLAMMEDTPEKRKQAEDFLVPITEKIEPQKVAVFGGKLDYSTLSPIFRFMFSRDTSGQMAEGDWRDWESIRHWAEDLADTFFYDL